MKATQLFTKTSRNILADETAKNAQLLLKAGFIYKEMAGVYAYLPLGLMVIENISNIIRQEMNAIGGNELKMTTLLSKEPWEKTGRWDDKKVDNWFKSKLVSGQEVGIGLTHEEPIVLAVKQFCRSYKDFPVYPYQIQTKFRNELRAKSGLLRGREFLMKDLYSFSRNQAEHEDFYEKAIQAYFKVFERLGFGGITYKTFASGGIFSQYSHEFQTLSPIGEDTIYVSQAKNVAINKEVMNDEVLHDLGVDKAELTEETAVEVANIFSLGSKYADDLGLKYIDENGQNQSLIMGCYGIGVSRLMGLVAEHFADNKGLVWPINISPFKVYLAQLDHSDGVNSSCQEIYDFLNQNNVSVFWDDRNERPGVKFGDADLYGFPFRLVISEKTLATQQFEIQERLTGTVQMVPKDSLLKVLGNH
jgi:prolyl-tRNA synthetase